MTVDDNSYKYKYIVYEDGQFYGVKDNPGEDVKFPIDTEDVADVLMRKNGIPTWFIAVLIGALAIGILVCVIAIEPKMPYS